MVAVPARGPQVRAGGIYISLTHSLPTHSKTGVAVVAFACNHSRVDNLETLYRMDLVPVVSGSYPMDQAVQALVRSRSGSVVGKLGMRCFTENLWQPYILSYGDCTMWSPL